MAYSQVWSNATPDGAITAAADIDAEFRNLKTAISERLDQIVGGTGNWATDGVDPKKIGIVVGAEASLPGSPDFQGEMYFAEDTFTLYIADTSPAWVAVGGGGGGGVGGGLYLSAYLTAPVAVSAGATQALSGWTALATSGGIYSAGNPTRFTIPAVGVWVAIPNVAVDGYISSMWWRKNGTTPTGITVQHYPTGTGDLRQNTSWGDIFVPSLVGDYYELMFTNSHGSLPTTVRGTVTTVALFKVA